MKRVFALYIIFILTGRTSYAQETAGHSQRFINPFLYNPAYAGANGGNIFLLYKTQWTGIEGGPKYSTFTVDKDLNEKIGLGLNIKNETKGLSSKLNIEAAYAYTIKLDEERHFNFGASGGIINNKINFTKAVVTTQADPSLLTRDENKIVPTASAGAAFRFDNFYADAGINQLFGNKINYTGENASAVFKLSQQLIASVKYEFELAEKPNMFLTPMLMINYSKNAPFNYEAILNASWNNIFWIAASYKNNYAITGVAGVNFSNLKIGYAYEMPLNSIKAFSGPGHEIVLMYKFSAKSGQNEKLPPSKIKRIERRITKLNGELKIYEKGLKRKQKDVERMIDRYYVRIKKGMKAESPESLRQRKAIEDAIAEQTSIELEIEEIKKEIEKKSTLLKSQ